MTTKSGDSSETQDPEGRPLGVLSYMDQFTIPYSQPVPAVIPAKAGIQAPSPGLWIAEYKTATSAVSGRG